MAAQAPPTTSSAAALPPPPPRRRSGSAAGSLRRDTAGEEEVYQRAETLLADHVVLRKGERTFGLARCACAEAAGRSCTCATLGRAAGWLAIDSTGFVSRAVSKASAILKLEHDSSKRRFCVFDTAESTLAIFKSENKSAVGPSEAELLIPASRIKTIEAFGSRADSNMRQYSFQIGYLDQKEMRQAVLLFKPLNNADIELASRWMALLLYHTHSYDRDLDRRAASALHAVRTVQRAWRRSRLRSRLKGHVSTKTDQLSPAAKPSLGRVQHAAMAVRGIVALQRAMRRSMSANLTKPGEARAAPERKNVLEVDCNSPRESSVLSIFGRPGRSTQHAGKPADAPHDSGLEYARDNGCAESDASESEASSAGVGDHEEPRGPGFAVSPQNEAHRWVPPLESDEEEDEVWENQRWNIISIKERCFKRGYSHHSLLPQERCAFTDRLGNKIGTSIEDLQELDLPSGWELSVPFTVDMSGLAHARCDAEGWRYEAHFNALDAKQAAGRQRGKASARWVARHRRWYRRRRPVTNAPPAGIARPPQWMAHRGWLGVRDMWTGVFWQNRFCIIAIPYHDRNDPACTTPAGLTVPFMAYISTKLAQSALRDNFASMDWAALTQDDIKMKVITSDCRIDDQVATPDKPGRFAVHFHGSNKPQMLNADSATERLAWIAQFRRAIEHARPRAETCATVKQDIADRPEFADLIRLERSSSSASDHSQSMPSQMTGSPTRRAASKLGELGRRSAGGMRRLATRSPSPSLRNHTRNKEAPLSAACIDALADASCDAAHVQVSLAAASKPLGNSVPSSRASNGMPDSPDLAAETPWVEPAAYDNLLLDMRFPSTEVDDLFDALFREDKFHDQLYDADGFTEVAREPWKPACRPGAQRLITYMMPRNGPVPKNQASLTWTIAQLCPGKGFQVDQEISNPGVIYGSTFTTLLRFVMTVEPEAGGCRLQVSHKVNFVASTMMKQFIRTAGTREVTAVFKTTWTRLLTEQYLKSKPVAMPRVCESELASSAPAAVDLPPALANIVACERLMAPVDAVAKLILDDEEGLLAQQLGAADVDRARVQPWSNGPAQVDSRRTIGFVMARNGIIPRHHIDIEARIARAEPGVAYCLENTVSNRGVPFGSTFHNTVQISLAAAEPAATDLVVSFETHCGQANMLRKYIKSRSAKEISRMISSAWLPSLSTRIQTLTGKPAVQLPGGGEPMAGKNQVGRVEGEPEALARLESRVWWLTVIVAAMLFLMVAMAAQLARLMAHFESLLENQRGEQGCSFMP